MPTAYETACLADAPSHLLSMDETTGTFADLSGNNRPFTYVAGTRGQPGVYDGSGKSCSGGGFNNVIARRDSLDGLSQGSMSFDCWVQIPTGNIRGCLFSTGTQNGISFGFGSNGSGGLDNYGRYFSILGNYYGWGQTNALMPDTGAAKAYHVGLSVSGSTWTCYLNGSQVFQAGLGYNAPGALLEIGGLLEGGYIRGLDSTFLMDTCAFYPSVLTQAKFNSHYQAGLKPPDPPTYLDLLPDGKTLVPTVGESPVGGRRRVTVYAAAPAATVGADVGKLWLDNDE